MISMAGKAIRRWWALFALPTFAAFIIGFLVPFIMGVYLSFCEFTTVTDGEWVGLKNYGKALKDKEFLHALGFSTAFTIVTTIVINVIAFAIAYMLTKAIKGSTLFRSVFFMPNLIGGIILGYIWLLLLNGVLAHWGRSITFSGVYGFWGMVLLTCWQQIGYMMIIYIAGLQNVPLDLIEAAKIDGASMFQRILHIDIPELVPMIVLQLIMSVGNLMNVGFEKVLLLQTELNKATSDIIAVYVYEQGIINAKYSYSTAVGLFNTVVNIILLIIVNRIAKKAADVSFV